MPAIHVARIASPASTTGPILGPSYQMFVATPDKDGLDIAGVRPMQIRVPLGTTMAWNIRAPGHRSSDLFG
jgi:hypothetical protein